MEEGACMKNEELVPFETVKEIHFGKNICSVPTIGLIRLFCNFQ